MNPVEMTLMPVGRVRSPWAEPHDVPLAGGPAIIEIAPEYQAALEGIERASHLVVIAFLDRADRSVLRASPRKLGLHALPCGVFATRSPARPNPLSLTMVELSKRDGRLLHVQPLDLADGTPVIDLKAYSPGWDSVFAARTARRIPAWELPDALLRVMLERDVQNHLGERASDSRARAALEAMVMLIHEWEIDPRDPRLRVEVDVCDAGTDALMAMSGASFANGRIRVRQDAQPGGVHFFAGQREHTERFE
jgi:tRNA (adenine37-N6)-methyltransferase